MESTTIKKVITTPKRKASEAIPHKGGFATDNTQTLVGAQEMSHSAATDQVTLVAKEHNVAEETRRQVQEGEDTSYTGTRKGEMFKNLPRATELAPALAKHPADHARTKTTSWLKADNAFLRSGSRANPRSLTPTPTSRPFEDKCHERRLPSGRGFGTSPAASKAGDNRAEPPAFTSLSGFTPINACKPMEAHNEPVLDNKPEISMSPIESRRSRKQATIGQPPAAIEKTLIKADVETRDGFLSAERLSQEAIRLAELQDGYLAAKKLSQEEARRAIHSSPTRGIGLSTGREKMTVYRPSAELAPAGKTPNNQSTDYEDYSHQMRSAHNQAVPDMPAKDRRRTNSKSAQGSPHALPASTSVPGIEHRRTTSGSSSSSAESTPYRQALEAAKAPAFKRLSFTASGNVKFGSRSPIGGQRSPTEPMKQGSPLKQTARKQLSPEKKKNDSSKSSTSDMSPPKDVSGTPSGLADAQIVPQEPGVREPVQSAPSTNLLETDMQSVKFLSTEEGDSDIHFSTQAAIVKAQRSFQTDLASPPKDPSKTSPTVQQMRLPEPIGPGPAAETTKAAITPFRTFHKVDEDPSGTMFPPALDEEPMSTQAMIDAATPFTRSTIRKSGRKKKASFVPSPTDGKGFGNVDDIERGYGKLGLDMETSPDVPFYEELKEPTSNAPSAFGSPPKQSSSIHLRLSPAFSIAPNGTLMEVYQQDGQRPAADWDLNAVIDDAGSFLGSWDVDNELKRATVSSYGKATSEGSRQK